MKTVKKSVRIFMVSALIIVAGFSFNQNQHLTNRAISAASDPEETVVVSVVQKTSPAVVSVIATEQVSNVQRDDSLQAFCDDPFFSQYFEDQCSALQGQTQQGPGTTTQQVAAGTGFVVSSNGIIVTNKHVVNITGASYSVITDDNKTYPAQVLLRDPDQDIAILKIDAKNLPTSPE
jgi:serine protease Do